MTQRQLLFGIFPSSNFLCIFFLSIVDTCMYIHIKPAFYVKNHFLRSLKILPKYSNTYSILAIYTNLLNYSFKECRVWFLFFPIVSNIVRNIFVAINLCLYLCLFSGELFLEGEGGGPKSINTLRPNCSKKVVMFILPQYCRSNSLRALSIISFFSNLC